MKVNGSPGGRAIGIGLAFLPALAGLLILGGCGAGGPAGGPTADAAGPSAAAGAPAEDGPVAEPGPAAEPGPDAAAGGSAGSHWALLHWNVKSGFGQAGWTGGCGFEPGSDDSRNAWGSGVMPATLLGLVAAEPEIAVISLNEAWTSATPQRVRALLRWRDVHVGPGGLGIVARHGFAGACATAELPRCDAQAETRSVVACPVYTDETRRASVVVHATHWTGCEVEGRATADLLRGGGVRVLAGDLNEKDPDSPAVAPLLAAGFVDAWRRLEGGGGATATWNRQYGEPRGNLYKRIDYALSRGVTPERITRFNHTGTPGTCKESDHAGLVVRYPQPR